MDDLVLFSDNHLLVVNKPAGISTQKHSEELSLEEMAKEWVKIKFQKSGNVFLHPIHRLDKAVSGIVVFAKTSKALTRLTEAMKLKKCSKIYHAILEGMLTPEQGTLEHYLIHDEYYAKIAKKNDQNAKYCCLQYRLLKKYSDSSLVEIKLETGRYHQIRAQCAAKGHPVMGDTKYGSKKALHSQAIYLHHGFFQINHPTLKVDLSWKAPIPSDWPCASFFI